MGATPGEQQLGQTEDANELVHGNPGRIRESAKHLKDFQKAFDKVGGGMRQLHSSHWKGKAADTFRELLAGMRPPKSCATAVFGSTSRSSRPHAPAAAGLPAARTTIGITDRGHPWPS
ncbi:putative T7SS-secreted protein [Streptomyces sp. NBC_00286]|uniref:putative T7SS-secreted protein n=1 Tax=Streptomyces sp. NBC_00286 TaxID=2975701 RepID=UPI002E2832FF|nr:hypothetical protein [Streptomyces sp. NBC_00286]